MFSQYQLSQGFSRKISRKRDLVFNYASVDGHCPTAFKRTLFNIDWRKGNLYYNACMIFKKNNWGRRRIYAFRNVVGQDLSQLRTFNVWSSCIIWILSDSHIIIYLNCVNQYIRFFYIWMEPIHDTWSIWHSTSHRWTHKLHCGHVLVLDALHTFKWRCTFAYDRIIFSNIMEEWSVQSIQ